MAPFYIGNTSLKAYIGGTEIQKIYQGNNLSYQNAVADPTIVYVSKTDSSISFTITNNHSSTATIYYDEGVNPEAGNGSDSVSLAAGATSSTLTISGLSDGVSYNIYARGFITGVTSSNIVSLNVTTAAWTQLGSEYDKSSSSALRGTYNGSTWFMPTFNNSSVYASTWKLQATSDSGAWSNEYWTRLLVEDYSGTSYTDTSIVSYAGYITTYINAPSNAFGNNSNTAASISGGNHNGSSITLSFGSSVRLNKLWIRTGYTKISGMTLYYLG